MLSVGGRVGGSLLGHNDGFLRMKSSLLLTRVWCCDSEHL